MQIRVKEDGVAESEVIGFNSGNDNTIELSTIATFFASVTALRYHDQETNIWLE